MSDRTRRSSSPQVASPAVRIPKPSDSGPGNQEQLRRAKAGTLQQATDTPFLTNHAVRSGSADKTSDETPPGEWSSELDHDDPEGKHAKFTRSSEPEVTRQSAPRFKETEDGRKLLDGRTPGESRQDTTTVAVGASGQSAKLSGTMRRRHYEGVGGAEDADVPEFRSQEGHMGASYNADTGLVGTASASQQRVRRDEDGRAIEYDDGSGEKMADGESLTFQANRDGGSVTAGIERGSISGAGTITVEDGGDKLGAGIAVQKRTGEGKGVGVAGNAYRDRDTLEVETHAAHEVTGGLRNTLQVYTEPTPDVQQPEQLDALHSVKRDYGWGVDVGVSAQGGVFGVSAGGYVTSQNGIQFSVPPSQEVKETDLAGLTDEKASTIAELYEKDPDAADEYMELRYGGQLQKDGETLSDVKDLPIAEMEEGESYTLESGSSFGGGGGLSVYGVGVSGSAGRALQQRTSIVKDEAGGVSIDIEVADQTQIEGGVEALGMLKAGGEANWGESSRVRFRFPEGDEGKKQLEAFQRTGVLPGAIQPDDPQRARYLQLASNEAPSKREQAELVEMAERYNPAMMERVQNTEVGQDAPSGEGFAYTYASVGSHRSAKGGVSFLGHDVIDGGSSDAVGKHLYVDEAGNTQHGFSAQHTTDNWFDDDEEAAFASNLPGLRDYSADLTVNDESYLKDLYEIGGDYRPSDERINDTWVPLASGRWGNGYDDTTTASVSAVDSDAGRVQDAMADVDLSDSTWRLRSEMAGEQRAKDRLSAPVPDGQLADQLVQNRAVDQSEEWAAMAADPKRHGEIPDSAWSTLHEARAQHQKAVQAKLRQDELDRQQAQDDMRKVMFTNNCITGDTRSNGLDLRQQDYFDMRRLTPGAGGGSNPGSKLFEQLLKDTPEPQPHTFEGFQSGMSGRADQAITDGMSQEAFVKEQFRLLSIGEQNQAREGTTDEDFLEGSEMQELTAATSMVRDYQKQQLEQARPSELAQRAHHIQSGEDFTSADPEVQRALTRASSGDTQLLMALALEGKGKTTRAVVLQDLLADHEGKTSENRVKSYIRSLGRLTEMEGMDEDMKRLVAEQVDVEYK